MTSLRFILKQPSPEWKTFGIEVNRELKNLESNKIHHKPKLFTAVNLILKPVLNWLSWIEGNGELKEPGES